MNTQFASLVSLACHDLRTPLATVQGFAKTLVRQELVDERVARWLGLIDDASDELVQLLDLLSVSARIEAGRYEPIVRTADSLELARAGVPEATGTGGDVTVDVDWVPRAVRYLARAASRHGGVDVSVVVDGSRIAIEPVVAEAARIVLGEDLRDLGAAVSVQLIGALGGSVTLTEERLWIELPA